MIIQRGHVILAVALLGALWFFYPSSPSPSGTYKAHFTNDQFKETFPITKPLVFNEGLMIATANEVPLDVTLDLDHSLLPAKPSIPNPGALASSGVMVFVTKKGNTLEVSSGASYKVVLTIKADGTLETANGIAFIKADPALSTAN